MKGQWFLISAVVASGVFLAISGLFKSYLAIETSDVAITNEDFYFNNVRDQFFATASATGCSDEAMRGFRAFAERETADLGYLLYMNYPPGCGSLGLLLASNRMVVCQNVNATQFLPNVDVTCANV